MAGPQVNANIEVDQDTPGTLIQGGADFFSDIKKGTFGETKRQRGLQNALEANKQIEEQRQRFAAEWGRTMNALNREHANAMRGDQVSFDTALAKRIAYRAAVENGATTTGLYALMSQALTDKKKFADGMAAARARQSSTLRQMQTDQKFIDTLTMRAMAATERVITNVAGEADAAVSPDGVDSQLKGVLSYTKSGQYDPARAQAEQRRENAGAVRQYDQKFRDKDFLMDVLKHVDQDGKSKIPQFVSAVLAGDKDGVTEVLNGMDGRQIAAMQAILEGVEMRLQAMSSAPATEQAEQMAKGLGVNADDPNVKAASMLMNRSTSAGARETAKNYMRAVQTARMAAEVPTDFRTGQAMAQTVVQLAAMNVQENADLATMEALQAATAHNISQGLVSIMLAGGDPQAIIDGMKDPQSGALPGITSRVAQNLMDASTYLQIGMSELSGADAQLKSLGVTTANSIPLMQDFAKQLGEVAERDAVSDKAKERVTFFNEYTGKVTAAFDAYNAQGKNVAPLVEVLRTSQGQLRDVELTKRDPTTGPGQVGPEFEPFKEKGPITGLEPATDESGSEVMVKDMVAPELWQRLSQLPILNSGHSGLSGLRSRIVEESIKQKIPPTQVELTGEPDVTTGAEGLIGQAAQSVDQYNQQVDVVDQLQNQIWQRQAAELVGDYSSRTNAIAGPNARQETEQFIRDGVSNLEQQSQPAPSDALVAPTGVEAPAGQQPQQQSGGGSGMKFSAGVSPVSGGRRRPAPAPIQFPQSQPKQRQVASHTMGGPPSI